VQYEDLLVGARTAQFARQRPPLQGRLALSALASPGLAAIALPLARALGRLPARPRIPATAAPGKFRDGAIGLVGLFVGCVGREYEAATRVALEALLMRAGWWPVEVRGQGCCGTAAAHAGDAPAASALAARNRKAFTPVDAETSLVLHHADLGDDTDAIAHWPDTRTVLSLATGCQSVLAASLEGVADVVDALDFLDRQGNRLAFRPATGRIALHRPCSQRVLGTDAALLRLLSRIPGLDLVELPDTGCCGAAGTHMLTEPARAAALRAPLLEALAASGASGLLSANLGCRLHLGNAVSMPVRHPIDFLAEHLA
jgi:glycolate oxidase iron-sulfur subunit